MMMHQLMSAAPRVASCRCPSSSSVVFWSSERRRHHGVPNRAGSSSSSSNGLAPWGLGAAAIATRGRHACVSCRSSVEVQEHEARPDTSCLERLLVWLVSNGVVGIGRDDSPLSLYEDAEGDRGVVAEQDIAAGEVLLRVPLRLAITDVLEEEDRQRVVGQGAMWQDRLVAKLLQELQRGEASPWHPYLQALPRSVPSALDTFSHAEAEEVQLPSAVAAIQGHAEQMRLSWAACRPDAIGGADLAAYRWAHTVVMSRTFGNASPHGGVGVRMLVPALDLLNHAGDTAPNGLLSSPEAPVPTDNVRWDVVGPESSPSGSWEMALSATRDIPEGSPLGLSYREGLNEEFLLAYGFVPPANPHDTVTLAPDLSAALEHVWQQELSQGKSPDELRALHRAAHEAGLQALQDEVAAAAGGVGDASTWGQLLEALEPVKVASGSRVSAPLIAALEVLHGGDMAAVGAAVASLAWQQLAALPTSLLWDLAWLVQDGWQCGDEVQAQLYGGLLRHYVEVMVPAYLPQLQEQLAAAAAAAPGGGGATNGAGSMKKKRSVPGPARPPQQQQQQQVHGTQQATSQLDTAALPLPVVVDTVLQQQQQQSHHQQSQQQEQQHQQQQQHLSGHGGSSSSGSSSSEAEVQLEQQGGRVRRSALRLAVKFRVNKKMLLADVVLAAPVPMQQLEEQRQRLEAFRASAAAAGLAISSSDSDGDAVSPLPWQ